MKLVGKISDAGKMLFNSEKSFNVQGFSKSWRESREWLAPYVEAITCVFSCDDLDSDGQRLFPIVLNVISNIYRFVLLHLHDGKMQIQAAELFGD